MTVTSQMEREEEFKPYAHPDSRKILDFLLKNLQTNLTHEVLSNDEISYPQLALILGSQPKDQIGLLEKMVSAGVLLAELVDKVPACPECGSQQVSTRYICPQCFAHDITRSYLFEHLKCGKVGNDDIFRKGNEIVCPKCQAVLHEFGVEYRAVGVWYKCNRCENSFNNPSHSHFCRPNHHEFTPDRVKLLPLYQYRLNQNALNEIRRGVLLHAEAITFLENLGLNVRAPHALTGKSGQPQVFDVGIIAPKKRWGSERTATIDFLIGDSPAGNDQVKTLAAKVKEAKPTDSFIVAVPSLSEEARQIAGNLKLHAIEGPNLKEAMKALQADDAFKEYLT